MGTIHFLIKHFHFHQILQYTKEPKVLAVIVPQHEKVQHEKVQHDILPEKYLH